MAVDQSTRIKVEAELRLGKPSKDLAQKYSIPYATIRSWAVKLDSAMSDDDVNDILGFDETTLHTVVEDLKQSKASMPEVAKVEKLIESVVGLQRLEEKTREISLTILNKVEAFLEQKEEPNLRDLRDAAGIVSTLHTSLFNKNSTQVNVLNNNTNNISTEKREIFKSSLGA